MRLEDLRRDLSDDLAALGAAGMLKRERVIDSAQSAHIRLLDGRSVLNLCSNNYLGFADHPAIVAAAKDALDRWGFGVASVRFIVGTQSLHVELEERLSTFLGTEATILFGSCFEANTGLFETLLGAEDVVICDALNHASIIDGVRLCKARRLRYANGDMEQLEARLREASDGRRRLIATDGVFSMDGYVARLEEICDLAERHDALVMVDDSHAAGFVGPNGRGTHELTGVIDRIDILTGTLGKALGGASGGYASGRREIIDVLRQRSRPYLFSNSVAPPIVAAALTALDLLGSSGELRDRLAGNTSHFRSGLEAAGLDVRPGDHPIVPVMFGDAPTAERFAARLLDHGVYAVPFSYPVVPRGTARIRTQVSAAHSPADLSAAVAAFARVREEHAEA
jgi:glycine C-acetyltransferase